MEEEQFPSWMKWCSHAKTTKIQLDYEFDARAKIGTGAFATVYKALHKQTGEYRAIKVVEKRMIRMQERFIREIEVMKSLDHPNIVRLYETYEDERSIYNVLEYCGGGELFDLLANQGYLKEDKARDIFLQLVLAVKHCHSKNVTHRDLKPENILLVSPDDYQIKLTDFDASRLFEKEDETGRMEPPPRRTRKSALKTKVGTPYYIAPEVLEGSYDERCDIWSSGVILYVLLCGAPPFNGKNDDEIMKAIKRGKYHFDYEEWKSVSENAKDLIRLLITTPDKRLTPDEILQHNWLQELVSPTRELPIVQSSYLLKSAAPNRIKIACRLLLLRLGDDLLTQYAKFFSKFTSGEDVITRKVLGINSTLFSSEELDVCRALEKFWESDQRECLSFTEFVIEASRPSILKNDDSLFSVFKLIDKKLEGNLNQSNLHEFFSSEEDLSGLDPSFWGEAVKSADEDGDGVIDYAEFISVMKR
eukprot:TRINITY_DN11984_c0_g2_i1.p1 TRINITY_DN11984_c0_g2~~TRINITY_DN11984_c0_g2_i1.p1  ORF type:complete len:475 (+),score=68.46 TRINITY_DN11984_c0_g2_i1:61-1485(+)